MKALIFITSLFIFSSCQKDYCLTATNANGEDACVLCFRNESKANEYFQNVIDNWEANGSVGGFDYCK